MNGRPILKLQLHGRPHIVLDIRASRDIGLLLTVTLLSSLTGLLQLALLTLRSLCVQLQLMATEKTVAQNKHHRETVLADTRKAAEKQQQEYGLMARRRRLTVTAFELLPASKDERHQNLLQQILKYEAIFDSLKLATQSHDKHVC